MPARRLGSKTLSQRAVPSTPPAGRAHDFLSPSWAFPNSRYREVRYGNHLAPRIVSSITHCDGYCAAQLRIYAISKRSVSMPRINEPLPRGVFELVVCPEEIYLLKSYPPANVHWARLIFSSKESVFKAWYPLDRCWLGFEDVFTEFDPVLQTFHARITDISRAHMRRKNRGTRLASRDHRPSYRTKDDIATVIAGCECGRKSAAFGRN